MKFFGGGGYEICCTTTTNSHWIEENQQVEFQMRVSYDTDTEDEKYADSAKTENMEKIFKSFQKLMGKTKLLIDVQDMSREKENDLFQVFS